MALLYSNDLLKEVIAGIITASLIAFLVLRTKWPRIPIWAFMALTSFTSVISGLTSVDELGKVVDFEVILFLIGMFSIVGVAESSGLLDAISSFVVSKFKRGHATIVGLSVMFGFLSAIAVNDTIAVMGPPMVYSISRALELDPKPLILLLAFSITIGSAMTPIGNPQNMLIAVESGLRSPFIFFFKHLFMPTMINLVLTALIVIKVYKIPNKRINALNAFKSIRDRRSAIASGVALLAVVVALLVNDLLSISNLPHVEHRGFIPFIVAAAMFIAVPEPRELIKRVDWGTVIFFITMFITMDGVWKSGLLLPLLSFMLPTALRSGEGALSITASSIALSQLLSNVPCTKLLVDYMKYLGYSSNDIREWITLAMSSTIAGNVTLLGAASNIIILERLESQYGRTISFTEFSKVGLLVTACNIAIYVPFVLL